MKETTYRTGIGNKAASIIVDYKTCNLCGACVSVCGTGLIIKNGKVVFDPEASAGCIGCGQCMASCPTGSIIVEGRKMSPEKVILLPPVDKCASPNQLESLLLRRRSVRNFERKAVEKNLIDRVIQIASTAPMGIPPSDVGIIVLEGKSLKEFRNDMIQYFKGASRFMFNPLMMGLMRIFSKKRNYEMYRDFLVPVIHEYIEDSKENVDSLLYDCPVVMIFHISPYAGPEDAVIAATYAMEAAESLGLGSCLNGMVGPFLGRSKRLKKKYGIPLENSVPMALMLGHSTVEYHKAIRREFAKVSFYT